MAKQYSRKRARRPQPQARHSSSGNGWVWLMIGLIVGLGVAGLLFLKQHNKEEHKLEQLKASEKKLLAQKKAEPAKPAQPQFDFYTMLPKMQVGGPNPSTTTQQAPTPSKPTVALPQPSVAVKPLPAPTVPPITSAATEKPSHYWLQAGLLKDYGDADQLKAELTMSGYDVTIHKVKTAKGLAYKVLLGPYENRNAAEEQKAKLRKNKMDTLVVKDE